jgi:uncharacterized repeat protein (TIGR01451 family)
MEVIARVTRTIALIVSFVAVAAASGEGASSAGTQVTNTITATYADSTGSAYVAQSNTVVVTVNQVGAIVVSPKETAVNPATESYPVGTAITRTFQILNAGNAPDAYTITSVAAGAGSLSAIAFVTPSGTTPVPLGSLMPQTVSPTVAPGATIAVVVTLATTGIPVNAPFSIALAARSTNTATANGVVSDSGRVWAVASPGAALSGIAGPASTIEKLVNAEPSTAAGVGQVVTYSIGFENYGGMPATNAVITDSVPAGIVPIASTVALNGTNLGSAATVSGQQLSVKVGTVPVGVPETITFNATVMTVPVGSTFINTASLSADGIAPTGTAPASVFVGSANAVFDGYAGSSSRIAGATVTVRDPTSGSVLSLPQAAAATIPPNATNANPYVTGADGTYSFVFSSQELGTAAQPAHYEIDISATGYRARRIAVSLTPDSNDYLYTATLQALDGQMLATAGGFSLTASNVTLSGVFGLLGNIPMFALHPLNVTKTVDRDIASGGDRLLYTVQFGGTGVSFGATRIVDTLPPGVLYAPGTARIDGAPLAPVQTGRVLTWTLPSTTQQHTLTYAAVIMPDVTEGTILINEVVVTAATSAGGTASGSATADTAVIAGALGNRIVITGRVYADAAGSGRFAPGDVGLPNVRVYLENGEYVVTDPNGRFTFPAVHPGEHVLRVDASTLPATVHPYDDRRYDSERSLERLLHGIFDAGLMQDVNFAVEPAR